MKALRLEQPMFKVLKSIHLHCTISTRAMYAAHDFMTDMFEKITAESVQLMRKVGRRTLTARDVAAAVKLVVQFFSLT